MSEPVSYMSRLINLSGCFDFNVYKQLIKIVLKEHPIQLMIIIEGTPSGDKEQEDLKLLIKQSLAKKKKQLRLKSN